MSTILINSAQIARDRAERHRATMAEELAEGDNTEKLWSRLCQIAAAEEQAHWYSFAAKIPLENLDAWLIRYSTTSSDDQWSGRGNDLRRIKNDAKMEALSTIALHKEVGNLR